MIRNTTGKCFRVLAVSSSSRGFGFAVVERNDTLVDWGVKTITGRSAGSILKVMEMIALVRPHAIVVKTHSNKPSYSARSQMLSDCLIARAKEMKVISATYSREEVNSVFFEDGEGTRHELAQILAGRFPAELGRHLPPKRQAWMSEDYRTGIFDAVALALTFRAKRPHLKDRY